MIQCFVKIMLDVSIITPVIETDINKKKFKNLLKSLVTQKVKKKIEWIIVGTDTAYKKFNKYNFKNNNLKIRFIVKNSNMMEAMNIAIKNSTTDFWLSLGADDRLVNDEVYEKIRYEINRENKKMSIFLFNIIQINKNKKIPSIEPDYCWSGGVVFGKKIHSKIGFFDESLQISGDKDIKYRIDKALTKENILVKKIYLHISYVAANGRGAEYLLAVFEDFLIRIKNEKNKFLTYLRFLIFFSFYFFKGYRK